MPLKSFIRSQLYFCLCTLLVYGECVAAEPETVAVPAISSSELNINSVAEERSVTSHTQYSNERALSTNHLLKTALALIFVCSLAFLVLRAISRFNNRQLFTKHISAKDVDRLQVVQRLNLDRESSIVVVADASGQKLVFGTTTKRISFLGILKSDGSFVSKQEKSNSDPIEAKIVNMNS